MVYSLELERSALGGLIRNPKVFYDLDSFISELDFFHKNHKTIYSVIKNVLRNGEANIDKVLIAERIKNLGIKFSNDFDPLEYIDSISFSPATEDQTLKYFKELSLYRVRREIHEIGKQLQECVKQGEFTSFNDIIAKSDAIYNQTIKSYSEVDAPVNLFENMLSTVEERGNNPITDFGYTTPFPEFNRLYGGLRPQNLYAIASRAGGAKSTFLSALSFGCHKLDPDIKVLYLDTEMGAQDQMFRLASAISGVPFWHIETGNFRKNGEFVTKIRGSLANVNNHKFYHYQVGDRCIDEVISVARRWYFSKVGRGQKALIVLDYIKMSSEKLTQNFGETQAIGEKINKLKRLSEEVNAPLLTAIQLNRAAEKGDKGFAVDDSSSFALSDRLQWFASFTAIFRAKSLEEQSEEGAQFGSHKMIVLKSRFQGKDARGFSNFIKRKFPDGSERYVSNYINFDVQNFNVRECGTLEHVIERQQHDYDLKDDKSPNEKLI